MKKIYTIILFMIIIILPNNFIFPQHQIKKYVFGIGNTRTGNSHYNFTNTIGQSFIGKTSGVRYTNYAGFWNQTKENNFTYPASIVLNYNQSFGNGDVNNTDNYRIVGLPGNSSIHVNLDGTYEYDWQVYWDNGDSADYLVTNSNFNFTPGKAYWLISKNSLTFTQKQVSTVSINDPDNSFPIELHSGWNLISTPFEKSTQWKDVKTINGLKNNAVLYSWDGNTYNNPDKMNPFEGYYFNNDGALTSLQIPYEPNGSLTKKLSEKEYPVNIENFLGITVKGNNEIEPSEVFIGVNKNSKNGFDENDYYAAPAVFQKVGISILRNELPKRNRRLFIEQRPNIGEGQEFDLEIDSDPNQPIKIELNGIKNFNDYIIFLLDNRLENLYDMKKEKPLTLTLVHKINEFKLYIGTEDYINKIKKSLIPDKYYLYQNYPNPFNPVTTLRFSIPRMEQVSIKIYNILGQVIKTLIDKQPYNPGKYEIEFNAKEFASGVYIASMETPNFKSQRKMVLLK